MKTSRRWFLPAFLMISACLCFTVALQGCTPGGKVDTTAVQAQLEQEHATIATQVAAQTAALQAAQASNNTAAATQAQQTLAALTAIDAKVTAAQAVLVKALNPDGSLNVGGIASTAAPLLPPPWNLIALIGGPLIAAGVQEILKRQAATQAQATTNSLAGALNEVTPSGHPAIAALTPDAKTALAGAIGTASVAKNGA